MTECFRRNKSLAHDGVRTPDRPHHCLVTAITKLGGLPVGY